MRCLLSIGEAARLLGVCANTLRLWEKRGKLAPFCRTMGGHRRYDQDELRALRSDGTSAGTGLTVAYARVSSHDQKDDLARQAERLRRECLIRGYGEVEVITDLGSGLNFAKRGLRRLLGLLLRRQAVRLVVTHKDRLLRFGSELVFEICRAFRIEVVVVEAVQADAMSTLAADVIELMTVFAARMHGARSHRNRRVACAQ